MRRTLAILAVALLPLPTLAQAASPASAETMTRAQYVQRASDAAGRRFDAIDTAHTGSLTREQIRAWRQSHSSRGKPAAATTE